MTVPSVTVELLQAQNRKLREENDELRETVRQLEERVFVTDPLPSWMPHLTPSEESILRLLMPGRLVSRANIYDDIYGLYGEDRDPKIIDVFVHRLRRKLRPFGITILTEFGRGFVLAASSVAQLRQREAA